MSDQLKPCPCCGGEAKRYSDNRVGCKKCGLRTVSDQSFLRKRAEWNARAESKPLTVDD